MLDTNEILALLKGPLEQFADRSAKWLLANVDNLLLSLSSHFLSAIRYGT